MDSSSLKSKIQNLSQNPGVYVFYGGKKEILYVGKATNLKSRVGSYFRNASPFGKGGQEGDLKNKVVPQIPPNLPFPKGGERPIEIMIHEVVDIKTIETDSVLEALILESNLIKKYQPKYNAMGKDDKSFSYFVITKEEWPRVMIMRKTDLNVIASEDVNDNSHRSAAIPLRQSGKHNIRTRELKNEIAAVASLPRNDSIIISKIFGPYTSKKQMEVALKIIRKIFPFHSGKQKTEKGCLDFQIGTCPGPYAGAITRVDYLKNIRGIRMILEGKKQNLVRKLEKEMTEHSDRHEFEKAGEVRNKIFALKHINDVALISKEDAHPLPSPPPRGEGDMVRTIRVEAYDISNISGQYAVGSMVVFKNGEPDKSQYRKFKIKTIQGADDVGMMREVLMRRFNNDWLLPDLILLDGGQGHLNMGAEVLRKFELNIPLAAVAKGVTRKISNSKFLISNQIPMSKIPIELKNIITNKNLIKQIMDEAHRFAIGYHRNLRKKFFVE